MTVARRVACCGLREGGGVLLTNNGDQMIEFGSVCLECTHMMT